HQQHCPGTVPPIRGRAHRAAVGASPASTHDHTTRRSGMTTRGSHLTLAAGLALGLAGAAGAQTLDQSRAYASELVADAGGRASALARQNGDFTVNVHGYTQFRYYWNNREDDGLEDDSTIGFQNTESKIQISGNIGNENWSYYIQFKFDDQNEGAGGLDDAYGSYKMGNGWTVRFGQLKLPLFRDELMSDTR